MLETNFAIGQIQTAAASTIGSGTNLSTFLSAAQPAFLNSQALGMQSYTVISNLPPANAWIQYTFTKTNGQVVTVTVTNQTGANSTVLTSQLYNAINSNPGLQGSDGVMASDYTLLPDSVTFNLYARSSGCQAAGIFVRPKSYGIIMSATQGPLTENLSDLQPRNHLYVTAGTSRLAVNFPLATTNLSDGYHTLTAVASEGSNVRTETQVSIPVQIHNNSLRATMTLLDLTNSVPVQSTYHIQVTASGGNITLITLYSTGGALGSVTNLSTATFPVIGTNLGVGQHPFYTIVQTSDDRQYRTQPQSVTFTP